MKLITTQKQPYLVCFTGWQGGHSAYGQYGDKYSTHDDLCWCGNKELILVDKFEGNV